MQQSIDLVLIGQIQIEEFWHWRKSCEAFVRKAVGHKEIKSVFLGEDKNVQYTVLQKELQTIFQNRTNAILLDSMQCIHKKMKEKDVYVQSEACKETITDTSQMIADCFRHESMDATVIKSSKQHERYTGKNNVFTYKRNQCYTIFDGVF